MRLTLPLRIRLLPNIGMKFLRCVLLLLLTFVLLGNRAWAFDAPAFQGDVLDEAGILSAADKNVLLQRIRALRENSGIWAAVYVARSLQQDAIENAAVTTFEKWKLGQAGKDNGLLVLIVPSERKMRIEVGYGLEGFITDAFSKRVIDEIYKPAFREKRFVDGLLQGFDAMAKMAGGEPMASRPEMPMPAQQDVDWRTAPRNFALTFGLNLLPGFLYLGALLYGRSKGRRESGSLWQSVRTLFFVGGFFGIFFGIFIAVFGAAFAGDPEVAMFIAIANAVFASIFVIPYTIMSRRFWSDAGYRRYLARERLLRIRKRSKKARKIFGVMFDPSAVSVSQGGTRRESSSSSSSFGSSSSSSSSSSDGGSSGGGGASGSW